MRLLHANIDSVASNGDNLSTIIDIYNPEIVGLNETKQSKEVNSKFDIDT